MRRSKRPGRNSAGSSTSARFVAAMMMMPSCVSKPVHLNQQGVFNVCSLFVIIAAAETNATASSNRVNLVNENKARNIFTRLVKHVAHIRADADEHFHEIRNRK